MKDELGRQIMKYLLDLEQKYYLFKKLFKKLFKRQ